MGTEMPNRPATPDESYYRGGQARRWGMLLLVVGLVWLVFELTSHGSIFGVGIGFVEQRANTPAQSFAVSRLVVRGSGADVVLNYTTGDQVSVAAERHGFGWNAAAASAALDRLDVEITQSGDTLTVEVQRDSNFIALFGRSPSVKLRIDVPEGVALDVQTASGDLEASGLRASGSIGTVSGDISITDSAGALQVSSTSGDVRMSGSFTSPRVETVSGDVEVDGAEGSFYVRTISGDMDLRGLRAAQLDLETTSGGVEVADAELAAQPSRISTISGDVDLHLARAADLKLDVSTVSGELSSHLELGGLQQDRRRLSGVVGAGTAALTISTTSGDVEIDGE